jgi:hypothetical protein
MELYTQDQLITIAQDVAKEITSKVVDKTAIEKICNKHAKPPFISVLQSGFEPLLQNPIVRNIHVKPVAIEKYITENPKPIDWTPTNPVCCGLLEKIKYIMWLPLSEDQRLTPHIHLKDEEIEQVLHCPICGAFVRDCMVPAEQLTQ